MALDGITTQNRGNDQGTNNGKATIGLPQPRQQSDASSNKPNIGKNGNGGATGMSGGQAGTNGNGRHSLFSNTPSSVTINFERISNGGYLDQNKQFIALDIKGEPLPVKIMEMYYYKSKAGNGLERVALPPGAVQLKNGRLVMMHSSDKLLEDLKPGAGDKKHSRFFVRVATSNGNGVSAEKTVTYKLDWGPEFIKTMPAGISITGAERIGDRIWPMGQFKVRGDVTYKVFGIIPGEPDRELSNLRVDESGSLIVTGKLFGEGGELDNVFKGKTGKIRVQAAENGGSGRSVSVELGVASSNDGEDHGAGVKKTTARESSPATGGADMDRVVHRLQVLAKEKPGIFKAILKQAFGGKISEEKADEFTALAASGKLPLPTRVKVVNGTVLQGAQGAYSSGDGGVIYINRSLTGSPDQMDKVLLEELGHHLDHILGGGDAKGDEGEIFSEAVTGGAALTEARLKNLRAQNDRGSIILDGKSRDVEFRGFGGSSDLYFMHFPLPSVLTVNGDENVNDQIGITGQYQVINDDQPYTYHVYAVIPGENGSPESYRKLNNLMVNNDGTLIIKGELFGEGGELASLSQGRRVQIKVEAVLNSDAAIKISTKATLNRPPRITVPSSVIELPFWAGVNYSFSGVNIAADPDGDPVTVTVYETGSSRKVSDKVVWEYGRLMLKKPISASDGVITVYIDVSDGLAARTVPVRFRIKADEPQPDLPVFANPFSINAIDITRQGGIDESGIPTGQFRVNGEEPVRYRLYAVIAGRPDQLLQNLRIDENGNLRQTGPLFGVDGELEAVSQGKRVDLKVEVSPVANPARKTTKVIRFDRSPDISVGTAGVIDIPAGSGSGYEFPENMIRITDPDGDPVTVEVYKKQGTSIEESTGSRRGSNPERSDIVEWKNGRLVLMRPITEADGEVTVAIKASSLSIGHATFFRFRLTPAAPVFANPFSINAIDITRQGGIDESSIPTGQFKVNGEAPVRYRLYAVIAGRPDQLLQNLRIDENGNLRQTGPLFGVDGELEAVSQGKRVDLKVEVFPVANPARKTTKVIRFDRFSYISVGTTGVIDIPAGSGSGYEFPENMIRITDPDGDPVTVEVYKKQGTSIEESTGSRRGSNPELSDIVEWKNGRLVLMRPITEADGEVTVAIKASSSSRSHATFFRFRLTPAAPVFANPFSINAIDITRQGGIDESSIPTGQFKVNGEEPVRYRLYAVIAGRPDQLLQNLRIDENGNLRQTGPLFGVDGELEAVSQGKRVDLKVEVSPVANPARKTTKVIRFDRFSYISVGTTGVIDIPAGSGSGYEFPENMIRITDPDGDPVTVEVYKKQGTSIEESTGSRRGSNPELSDIVEWKNGRLVLMRPITEADGEVTVAIKASSLSRGHATFFRFRLTPAAPVSKRVVIRQGLLSQKNRVIADCPVRDADGQSLQYDGVYEGDSQTASTRFGITTTGKIYVKTGFDASSIGEIPLRITYRKASERKETYLTLVAGREYGVFADDLEKDNNVVATLPGAGRNWAGYGVYEGDGETVSARFKLDADGNIRTKEGFEATAGEIVLNIKSSGGGEPEKVILSVISGDGRQSASHLAGEISKGKAVFVLTKDNLLVRLDKETGVELEAYKLDVELDDITLNTETGEYFAVSAGGRMIYRFNPQTSKLEKVIDRGSSAGDGHYQIAIGPSGKICLAETDRQAEWLLVFHPTQDGGYNNVPDRRAIDSGSGNLKYFFNGDLVYDHRSRSFMASTLENTVDPFSRIISQRTVLQMLTLSQPVANVLVGKGIKILNTVAAPRQDIIDPRPYGPYCYHYDGDTGTLVGAKYSFSSSIQGQQQKNAAFGHGHKIISMMTGSGGGEMGRLGGGSRFYYMLTESGHLVRSYPEGDKEYIVGYTGTNITRIAMADGGRLYGMDGDAVYHIDQLTGKATRLYEHGFSEVRGVFGDPSGLYVVGRKSSTEDIKIHRLAEDGLEFDPIAIPHNLHVDLSGPIAYREGFIYTMTPDNKLVELRVSNGNTIVKTREITEFYKAVKGLSHNQQGYLEATLADGSVVRIDTATMARIGSGEQSGGPVQARDEYSIDRDGWIKRRAHGSGSLINVVQIRDTDVRNEENKKIFNVGGTLYLLAGTKIYTIDRATGSGVVQGELGERPAVGAEVTIDGHGNVYVGSSGGSRLTIYRRIDWGREHMPDPDKEVQWIRHEEGRRYIDPVSGNNRISVSEMSNGMISVTGFVPSGARDISVNFGGIIKSAKDISVEDDRAVSWQDEWQYAWSVTFTKEELMSIMPLRRNLLDTPFSTRLDLTFKKITGETIFGAMRTVGLPSYITTGLRLEGAINRLAGKLYTLGNRLFMATSDRLIEVMLPGVAGTDEAVKTSEVYVLESGGAFVIGESTIHVRNANGRLEEIFTIGEGFKTRKTRTDDVDGPVGTASYPPLVSADEILNRRGAGAKLDLISEPGRIYIDSQGRLIRQGMLPGGEQTDQIGPKVFEDVSGTKIFLTGLSTMTVTDKGEILAADHEFVYTVDAVTGQARRLLRHYAGRVDGMVFDGQENTLLLSSNGTNNLFYFNLLTGRIISKSRLVGDLKSADVSSLFKHDGKLYMNTRDHRVVQLEYVVNSMYPNGVYKAAADGIRELPEDTLYSFITGDGTMIAVGSVKAYVWLKASKKFAELDKTTAEQLIIRSNFSPTRGHNLAVAQLNYNESRSPSEIQGIWVLRGGNTLVALDPVTLREIADETLTVKGATLRDIAIGADGTIIGVAGDNHLYHINPYTGVATSILENEEFRNLDSIAFDVYGNLYGFREGGNELLVFDTKTGGLKLKMVLSDNTQLTGDIVIAGNDIILSTMDKRIIQIMTETNDQGETFVRERLLAKIGHIQENEIPEMTGMAVSGSDLIITARASTGGETYVYKLDLSSEPEETPPVLYSTTRFAGGHPEGMGSAAVSQGEYKTEVEPEWEFSVENVQEILRNALTDDVSSDTLESLFQKYIAACGGDDGLELRVLKGLIAKVDPDIDLETLSDEQKRDAGFELYDTIYRDFLKANIDNGLKPALMFNGICFTDSAGLSYMGIKNKALKELELQGVSKDVRTALVEELMKQDVIYRNREFLGNKAFPYITYGNLDWAYMASSISFLEDHGMDITEYTYDEALEIINALWSDGANEQEKIKSTLFQLMSMYHTVGSGAMTVEDIDTGSVSVFSEMIMASACIQTIFDKKIDEDQQTSVQKASGSVSFIDLARHIIQLRLDKVNAKLLDEDQYTIPPELMDELAMKYAERPWGLEYIAPERLTSVSAEKPKFNDQYLYSLDLPPFVIKNVLVGLPYLNLEYQDKRSSVNYTGLTEFLDVAMEKNKNPESYIRGTYTDPDERDKGWFGQAITSIAKNSREVLKTLINRLPEKYRSTFNSGDAKILNPSFNLFGVPHDITGAPPLEAKERLNFIFGGEWEPEGESYTFYKELSSDIKSKKLTYEVPYTVAEDYIDAALDSFEFSRFVDLLARREAGHIGRMGAPPIRRNVQNSNVLKGTDNEKLLKIILSYLLGPTASLIEIDDKLFLSRYGYGVGPVLVEIENKDLVSFIFNSPENFDLLFADGKSGRTHFSEEEIRESNKNINHKLSREMKGSRKAETYILKKMLEVLRDRMGVDGFKRTITRDFFKAAPVSTSSPDVFYFFYERAIFDYLDQHKQGWVQAPYNRINDLLLNVFIPGYSMVAAIYNKNWVDLGMEIGFFLLNLIPGLGVVGKVTGRISKIILKLAWNLLNPIDLSFITNLKTLKSFAKLIRGGVKYSKLRSVKSAMHGVEAASQAKSASRTGIRRSMSTMSLDSLSPKVEKVSKASRLKRLTDYLTPRMKSWRGKTLAYEKVINTNHGKIATNTPRVVPRRTRPNQIGRSTFRDGAEDFQEAAGRVRQGGGIQRVTKSGQEFLVANVEGRIGPQLFKKSGNSWDLLDWRTQAKLGPRFERVGDRLVSLGGVGGGRRNIANSGDLQDFLNELDTIPGTKKMGKVNDKITTIDKRIKALRGELSTTQGNISKKRKALNTAKENFDKKHGPLKDTLDRTDDGIALRTKKSNEASSELADLEKQLADVDNNPGLRSPDQTQELRIKLNDKIETARQAVGTHIAELVKLKNKRSTLNSQIKKLTSEYNKIKNSLNKELARLTKRSTDLQNSITQSTYDLGKLKTVKSGLRSTTFNNPSARLGARERRSGYGTNEAGQSVGSDPEYIPLDEVGHSTGRTYRRLRDVPLNSGSRIPKISKKGKVAIAVTASVIIAAGTAALIWYLTSRPTGDESGGTGDTGDNTNAPKFVDGTLNPITVVPTAAVGTVVTTVQAVDADNDALTYSIAANDYFTIDSATGEVKVKAGADLSRLTGPVTLNVSVSDGSHKITKPLNVYVDHNTNAPKFADGTLNPITVPETANAGKVVTTVQAVDADNDALTYSIAANGYFTIDSATGEVKVKAGADLSRLTGSVNLNVSVSDGSHKITKPLNVYVNHKPLFTSQPKSIYDLTLPLRLNQQIASFGATDRDGNPLSYQVMRYNENTHIWEESVYFKVNIWGTGVEVKQTYGDDHTQPVNARLKVRVTDSGGLFTDSNEFTVSQNPERPKNQAPTFRPETPTTVTVAQTALPGMVVTTVQATDADNDAVTYSIAANDYFTIDSATGQVKVKDGADLSKIPAGFHVTVTAKDAHNLASDARRIAVTLSPTGAGRFSSKFVSQPRNVMVNTAAGVNTVVTSFQAADDQTTYEVLEQDAAGKWVVSTHFEVYSPSGSEDRTRRQVRIKTAYTSGRAPASVILKIRATHGAKTEDSVKFAVIDEKMHAATSPITWIDRGGVKQTASSTAPIIISASHKSTFVTTDLRVVEGVVFPSLRTAVMEQKDGKWVLSRRFTYSVKERKLLYQSEGREVRDTQNIRLKVIVWNPEKTAENFDPAIYANREPSETTQFAAERELDLRIHAKPAFNITKQSFTIIGDGTTGPMAFAVDNSVDMNRLTPELWQYDSMRKKWVVSNIFEYDAATKSVKLRPGISKEALDGEVFVLSLSFTGTHKDSPDNLFVEDRFKLTYYKDAYGGTNTINYDGTQQKLVYSVSENSLPESNLGRIKIDGVTDLDFDIDFDLGAGGYPFIIDDNGNIFLTDNLNFDEKNVYNFKVIITGNNNYKKEVEVQIRLKEIIETIKFRNGGEKQSLTVPLNAKEHYVVTPNEIQAVTEVQKQNIEYELLDEHGNALGSDPIFAISDISMGCIELIKPEGITQAAIYRYVLRAKNGNNHVDKVIEIKVVPPKTMIEFNPATGDFRRDLSDTDGIYNIVIQDDHVNKGYVLGIVSMDHPKNGQSTTYKVVGADGKTIDFVSVDANGVVKIAAENGLKPGKIYSFNVRGLHDGKSFTKSIRIVVEPHQPTLNPSVKQPVTYKMGIRHASRSLIAEVPVLPPKKGGHYAYAISGNDSDLFGVHNGFIYLKRRLGSADAGDKHVTITVRDKQNQTLQIPVTINVDKAFKGLILQDTVDMKNAMQSSVLGIPSNILSGSAFHENLKIDFSDHSPHKARILTQFGSLKYENVIFNDNGYFFKDLNEDMHELKFNPISGRFTETGKVGHEGNRDRRSIRYDLKNDNYFVYTYVFSNQIPRPDTEKDLVMNVEQKIIYETIDGERKITIQKIDITTATGKYTIEDTTGSGTNITINEQEKYILIRSARIFIDLETGHLYTIRHGDDFKEFVESLGQSNKDRQRISDMSVNRDDVNNEDTDNNYEEAKRYLGEHKIEIPNDWAATIQRYKDEFENNYSDYRREKLNENLEEHMARHWRLSALYEERLVTKKNQPSSLKPTVEVRTEGSVLAYIRSKTFASHTTWVVRDGRNLPKSMTTDLMGFGKLYKLAIDLASRHTNSGLFLTAFSLIFNTFLNYLYNLGIFGLDFLGTFSAFKLMGDIHIDPTKLSYGSNQKLIRYFISQGNIDAAKMVALYWDKVHAREQLQGGIFNTTDTTFNITNTNGNSDESSESLMAFFSKILNESTPGESSGTFRPDTLNITDTTGNEPGDFKDWGGKISLYNHYMEPVSGSNSTLNEGLFLEVKDLVINSEIQRSILNLPGHGQWPMEDGMTIKSFIILNAGDAIFGGLMDFLDLPREKLQKYINKILKTEEKEIFDGFKGKTISYTTNAAFEVLAEALLNLGYLIPMGLVAEDKKNVDYYDTFIKGFNELGNVDAGPDASIAGVRILLGLLGKMADGYVDQRLVDRIGAENIFYNSIKYFILPISYVKETSEQGIFSDNLWDKVKLRTGGEGDFVNNYNAVKMLSMLDLIIPFSLIFSSASLALEQLYQDRGDSVDDNLLRGEPEYSIYENHSGFWYMFTQLTKGQADLKNRFHTLSNFFGNWLDFFVNIPKIGLGWLTNLLGMTKLGKKLLPKQIRKIASLLYKSNYKEAKNRENTGSFKIDDIRDEINQYINGRGNYATRDKFKDADPIEGEIISTEMLVPGLVSSDDNRRYISLSPGTHTNAIRFELDRDALDNDRIHRKFVPETVVLRVMTRPEGNNQQTKEYRVVLDVAYLLQGDGEKFFWKINSVVELNRNRDNPTMGGNDGADPVVLDVDTGQPPLPYEQGYGNYNPVFDDEEDNEPENEIYVQVNETVRQIIDRYPEYGLENSKRIFDASYQREIIIPSSKHRQKRNVDDPDLLSTEAYDRKMIDLFSEKSYYELNRFDEFKNKIAVYRYDPERNGYICENTGDPDFVSIDYIVVNKGLDTYLVKLSAIDKVTIGQYSESLEEGNKKYHKIAKETVDGFIASTPSVSIQKAFEDIIDSEFPTDSQKRNFFKNLLEKDVFDKGFETFFEFEMLTNFRFISRLRKMGIGGGQAMKFISNMMQLSEITRNTDNPSEIRELFDMINTYLYKIVHNEYDIPGNQLRQLVNFFTKFSNIEDLRKELDKYVGASGDLLGNKNKIALLLPPGFEDFTELLIRYHHKLYGNEITSYGKRFPSIVSVIEEKTNPQVISFLKEQIADGNSELKQILDEIGTSVNIFKTLVNRQGDVYTKDEHLLLKQMYEMLVYLKNTKSLHDSQLDAAHKRSFGKEVKGHIKRMIIIFSYAHQCNKIIRSQFDEAKNEVKENTDDIIHELITGPNEILQNNLELIINGITNTREFDFDYTNLKLKEFPVYEIDENDPSTAEIRGGYLNLMMYVAANKKGLQGTELGTTLRKLLNTAAALITLQATNKHNQNVKRYIDGVLKDLLLNVSLLAINSSQNMSWNDMRLFKKEADAEFIKEKTDLVTDHIVVNGVTNDENLDFSNYMDILASLLTDQKIASYLSTHHKRFFHTLYKNVYLLEWMKSMKSMEDIQKPVFLMLNALFKRIQLHSTGDDASKISNLVSEISGLLTLLKDVQKPYVKPDQLLVDTILPEELKTDNSTLNKYYKWVMDQLKDEKMKPLLPATDKKMIMLMNLLAAEIGKPQKNNTIIMRLLLQIGDGIPTGMNIMAAMLKKVLGENDPDDFLDDNVSSTFLIQKDIEQNIELMKVYMAFTGTQVSGKSYEEFINDDTKADITHDQLKSLLQPVNTNIHDQNFIHEYNNLKNILHNLNFGEADLDQSSINKIGNILHGINAINSKDRLTASDLLFLKPMIDSMTKQMTLLDGHLYTIDE